MFMSTMTTISNAFSCCRNCYDPEAPNEKDNQEKILFAPSKNPTTEIELQEACYFEDLPIVLGPEKWKARAGEDFKLLKVAYSQLQKDAEDALSTSQVADLASQEKLNKPRYLYVYLDPAWPSLTVAIVIRKFFETFHPNSNLQGGIGGENGMTIGEYANIKEKGWYQITPYVLFLQSAWFDPPSFRKNWVPFMKV